MLNKDVANERGYAKGPNPTRTTQTETLYFTYLTANMQHSSSVQDMFEAVNLSLFYSDTGRDVEKAARIDRMQSRLCFLAVMITKTA